MRGLRLASLGALSDAGGRVNEDRAGCAGSLAWIIDGATGLGEDRFTPGATDAAYLADVIDARLRQGPAAGLAARMADVETHVAAHFAGLAERPDAPDFMAPSAALGLVTVTDGSAGPVAEGLFVADVVALVETPGGVVRWSDERLKPLEALTYDALRAGDPADGISPEVRRQILDNRRRINRPGGYWVVHPVRPFAVDAMAFACPIRPGARIVLATDGMMRLVDLFGVETDASLHAALAAGAAADLLARLRDLEADPASMRSYRRPKQRDDATVIVVEVVQDAGTAGISGGSPC